MTRIAHVALWVRDLARMRAFYETELGGRSGPLYRNERTGYRSYFVSFAAGQILPTSIGGDAVRIFETSRRNQGRVADLTAIVLLERGLGGAATVLLGAVGFALAIGRYHVGAYLWLEGAFVVGTYSS